MIAVETKSGMGEERMEAASETGSYLSECCVVNWKK